MSKRVGRLLVSVCVGSGQIVFGAAGVRNTGQIGPVSCVPFRHLTNGLAVVAVRASGRETVFLVDTGSTSTVVDERLAKDLGLASAGDVIVETALGPEHAPLVRLPLALGTRLPTVVQAISQSMAGVQAVDPEVRGILGQDVLGRASWLIDYRRRQIEIDESGELRRSLTGSVVAVDWGGARPIVAATLADGDRLRLVLDSGATGLVMFRPPRTGGAAVFAPFATRGATVVVRQFQTGALTVGGVTLMPGFASLSAGYRAAAGEDGLLPTTFFDAIYFDRDRSEVILNPRR